MEYVFLLHFVNFINREIQLFKITHSANAVECEDNVVQSSWRSWTSWSMVVGQLMSMFGRGDLAE
jgi:hypothetical protein